jgi:hypothetical protein
MPFVAIVTQSRHERVPHIARQYIAHGRTRVQELVTLELGPESELERLRKMVNEVGQERLTRLDCAILGQACANVLALTSAHEADPTRHAMRQGQFKTLERMGFAEERQPGVWILDAGFETKLRQLGDRADKFKMMERALEASGIARTPDLMAVFERGNRATPVVGQVVAVGLVDEVTDRQYVVVDGVDGSVHYAELGRRTPDASPQRSMIVRLAADRLDGRPQPATRLEVLSPVELRGQEVYAGPTWLDQVLAGKERLATRSAGFGADVERALTARADWLVGRRLADRIGDGQLQTRAQALAALRIQELEQIGRVLADRYCVSFTAPKPGMAITDTYEHSLSTPTAELAVIVAPWRPAMEALRGQRIPATMHPTQVICAPERAMGP